MPPFTIFGSVFGAEPRNLLGMTVLGGVSGGLSFLTVVMFWQGGLVEGVAVVFFHHPDHPSALVGGMASTGLREPTRLNRHPAPAGPAVRERSPLEG